MKRLLISTLAALLTHTAAFAELSSAVPAREPARNLDGTALSIDLEDSIVSQSARSAPAELPRTAPDFRASMPPATVPADWERPGYSSQTADVGGVLEFGAGSLIYLFALIFALYVRSSRAGARMMQTRSRYRRARRLSTHGE